MHSVGGLADEECNYSCDKSGSAGLSVGWLMKTCIKFAFNLG